MKPSPQFEMEHVIGSLTALSHEKELSESARAEVVQAVRTLNRLRKSLELMLPYLDEDTSRLKELLEEVTHRDPAILCPSASRAMSEPAVQLTGSWLTDIERANSRNEALRAALVAVIESDSQGVARSRIRDFLIDSTSRRPW